MGLWMPVDVSVDNLRIILGPEQVTLYGLVE